MKTKLDIVMAIPGMPISHDTLETKSLGGSETMGLQMAKTLAKRGHFVLLFCNTDKPGPAPDGVVYLPVEQFASFVATSPHDICIVQRLPELFSAPTLSKLNLLWCHDLALGRRTDTVRSVMWNIDKVMTVSGFMTEQYKEVYGLPDNVMWTTRNAIDVDLLKKCKGGFATTGEVSEGKRVSDPMQLVYAARPERGLDVLLEKIMPAVWKRIPEAHLKIAGYDYTTPEMQEFYNYLKNLASQHGERVEWIGHLTKKELYKLYSSSALYVYPTPSPRAKDFVEVSCITVMECAELGLPFISTANGALSDTASGQMGALIEPGENYEERFVDVVCSALTKQLPHIAGEKKHFDLDSLAEDWETEFVRFIMDNNNSIERLVSHFTVNSDIMPIKIAEQPLPEGYEFIESEEKYKEHHGQAGIITDERLSKIEWVDEHFQYSNEKRFALIEQCISESATPIERILDFGCGHGWCDVYLERRIGKEWTGVDVDPGAVKWSVLFASKFGKVPENFRFFTSDEWTKKTHTIKYDCLIVSEVLEHCIDPKATLEAAEKHVKPGGMVIITVPYGPREYPDYKRIKHRQHIHEIDFHSLREMIDKKSGSEIICVHETVVEDLKEPAGFYFARYRADHKPLGEIDMPRKLWLQRPVETVSGLMICGPSAEYTLHWCLDSIKHVVAECIIADCGMSEEAKRIAAQYDFVKIVPGVDPKEKGFDEARNEALKHCISDWVLWIDSDERLIGADNVRKYLRNSMYMGYSIRQHHFAVDSAFNPDMPVRLFRRRQDVKFFGTVHEHPETKLNEGPGVTIVLSDVHIAHVGYLWEPDRKKRFYRNLPLLEKSEEIYPDRMLNKYFRMRENMILVDHEVNMTKVVDDKHRKMCEETIELFRENFLGKPSFMNGDALEHYSKACGILGIGQDVMINLTNGSGPPEPRTYRFANSEDLKKELAWRAEDLLGRINSKWW